MMAALPPPFDTDLKVLVLAGSNPMSRRQRRLQKRRLRRMQKGRLRSSEREIPLQNKAFLELHGRLVIEYVLDWLRLCGLRRIWVLADREQMPRIPAQYEFTPIAQRPGATIFVNLSAAYAHLQPEDHEPVLVVFGDHPLNTPKALEVFLAACARQAGEADYFHGFALQEPYSEFGAWFQRTSVHMREMSGRATGLHLAFPSRLHRLRAIDHLYAVRKQEKLGSFFELMRRLIGWLGLRSITALLDSVALWLAKEAEKLGRRPGWTGRFGTGACAALSKLVPVARMEGYTARILQAERGVRLVPLAHGASALDVDFAEELRALEDNWSAVQEINRRQDAALVP